MIHESGSIPPGCSVLQRAAERERRLKEAKEVLNRKGIILGEVTFVWGHYQVDYLILPWGLERAPVTSYRFWRIPDCLHSGWSLKLQLDQSPGSVPWPGRSVSMLGLFLSF